MAASLSLLVLSPLGARAQGAWTMDSCMVYAVNHSTAVEMQLVEARQARTDYTAAALAFLPTVSGGVAGQYGWGRGIDPETNTYNNVTTFNNYYQLNASLAVFDGFQTLNAFRQARQARRHSQTALAQQRDAKAIEVMQAYVDAVYAQKSIGLATEKLGESRRLLLQTQRMFDEGQKSRPDVAQAEAQVAEDEYALLSQRNEARRTMLALKSAMNYPVADTLRLDSAVAAAPLQLPSTEAAESVAERFDAVSPEVLSARFDVKNSRYSYLISRGSLLPSLTLNGGIETSYYKNLSLGGVGESFARQFRNNRGEYLSLTLSIPIFNSSAWRNMRRARSDWQTAGLRLDETRRKVHDQVCQAVMDRDGYWSETRQIEKKTAADSLAHSLNLRKYEEGMLSSLELRTSSQQLLQSRIKLLQTRLLYEMKRRLVNYYKGEALVPGITDTDK